MSRRPHAKYLRSIFFFNPHIASTRRVRTPSFCMWEKPNRSSRVPNGLPGWHGPSRVTAGGHRIAPGTSSRGPSRVHLPQRTVSHTRVSFRLALEGKNGRFPQPDSCSLDRCATKTLKCVVKDQRTTQARKAVSRSAQATGRAA